MHGRAHRQPLRRQRHPTLPAANPAASIYEEASGELAGQALLSARPPRLALLTECPRAFLDVVRSDHPLHGVERVVHLEGCVLGHHFSMTQHLFDRGEQQGRSIDQLPGNFPRLGQALALGHDVIRQTPPCRAAPYQPSYAPV